MPEPSLPASESAKAALRRDAKDRITMVSVAVRAEWSTRIREELLSWHGLACSGPVLAFLPFPGEPDLGPLLQHLLETGRSVALPVLEDARETELRIVLVRSAADLEDIRPGALGTRHPAVNIPLHDGAVSLALVPGLAFDESGGRLGRGGGHFDRLLARFPSETRVVGTAFELQVVPSVPMLAHDRRVDFLCTERGLRPRR